MISIGTFIVPIFCPAQLSTPNDLEGKISDEIEAVFTDLYFNDYNGTTRALDKQIEIASGNNLWHLTLYALTLKAKCAYHHNIFIEILPVLQEAERVEKLRHKELKVLDSTHQVRSEIFYVRGLYHYTLGDFSGAIRNFDEIIKISKKFKSIDPITLQSIYFTIGYSYFEMTLYDKAFVNYEQATILSKEKNTIAYRYQQAKGDMFKGKCKESKALLIHDSLLVKEALQMYKSALNTLNAIKNDEKNKNALTSANIRIASAYRILKKYDSALYYFKTSLAITKEREDKTSILMGDLFKEQKQYTKAITYYSEAFAKVSLLYPYKHFEKSVPLIKKAEVLMLTKQYEDALKTCQAGLTFIVKDFNSDKDIFALPSNSNESNPSQLLDGVWLKAKILFNWHQHEGSKKYLDESLKTYQYAIGLIGEMQNNYPESTYKQDLAAKVQSFYEDALEAVYRASELDNTNTYYVDLFFSLLEANKNTLLRESFNNTYAKSFTNIPQDILDQETSLKGMMASLKRKIYETPYDTALNEWKTEVYKLSKQYDSLVHKIKLTYPEYYQLKLTKDQFTLDELKHALNNNTVLIEYFWGDRNLFILAIDNEKRILKKISAINNLSADIRALLESIHNPPTDNKTTSSTFAKTSYSLYKEIIDPVLAGWRDKNIQSLVIIPDGLLCYLPFDLLLTSLPSTASTYGTLPYLLKDYSIRNLFTASFIQPSKNSKKFEYPYLGFAPIYKKNNPMLISAARGGNVNDMGFLTHNVTEVKHASSFFNGKTFVNNEATELAFRNTASQARILHLSMHAFTNDYDPSFSGLVFTQDDSTQTKKEDDDGLMHLYELYNLSIKADLAVLSACETGIGKYARGEGITSLGSAFRYAGCENIVMSLWKVNDKSTSQIMEHFFKNLHNGMNKDEALRKAKLTFLSSAENKNFTHPYYWSAFVLTGDSLAITDSTLSVWVIALALAVLLLVVVYLLRVKR